MATLDDVTNPGAPDASGTPFSSLRPEATSLRPGSVDTRAPLTREPEETTLEPIAPAIDHSGMLGQVDAPASSVSSDPNQPEFMGRTLSALSDTSTEPVPGLKPGALQNIGVNWATPADKESKRIFSTNIGFYDVDYDPTGSRASRMEGSPTGVLAANVFGRQFTREELEKDEEGRRLLTLMEKQRTGELNKEGFWSGFTSFSDSSGSYRKSLSLIPFIGWMVDGGSTVSETIDMSKTMRKMQNGEAVTDHEALAVRRYMLQQEMESNRGIAYNVGSLAQNMPTFMVEMAASGAMIAASAKVGAWVGGVLAGAFSLGTGAGIGAAVGAGIGAAAGAVGAVVFGGFNAFGRLFGKKAVAEGAKQVGKAAFKRFAERSLEEGFTHAEGVQLRKAATSALGHASEAAALRSYRDVGRMAALEKLGRQLIEKQSGAQAAKTASTEMCIQAANNAGKALDMGMYRRLSRHEMYTAMARDTANVYTPAMSKQLAHRLLVHGDAEAVVRGSYNSMVEELALSKAGFTIESAPKGYFARRKAIKECFAKISAEEFDQLHRGFADGVLNVATDAASGSKNLVNEVVTSTVKKANEKVGGKGATNFIAGSMDAALGNGQTVHRGAAKETLDYLLNNARESLKLKYGAGSALGALGNDTTRVARWVGDGIMDGLMRWDTSMFGGLGTIARSGTALGGKVASLKEALKVALVEAPVRGAMQFGMQAPLWPAVAAASGNDPRDFVLKGQLGIQAQALRTGDRELMDHARAIAFGSGMIEYISENTGRGLNMLASGIVRPIVNDATALLPESTRHLGSWMSRKMEALFGTEQMMKKENHEVLASTVAKYLSSRAAEKGVKVAPVSMDELRQFVSRRSADGLRNLQGVINTLGVKEGKLLRDAIAESITHNKFRAGLLYTVSHYMLDKGLTPQKFSSMLERVGYDGIISEMAEERYGGFFQGLLGLDESPSDSTWRDRVRAAMDGLFPSKDQLITEAIGFAIPSVAHMSWAHLGRQLNAGGALGKVRNSSANLNMGKNTLPEISLSLDDPEYVRQVQDWRQQRSERFQQKFGTQESNMEKIGANAGKFADDVAKGNYNTDDHHLAQFKDATGAKRSTEETRVLMQELAGTLLKDANADVFENHLSQLEAEKVFGTEGVEALRNEWHRTHQDSSAVVSQYNKDDLTAFPAPLPANAEALSADDVINRVTMAIPALAQDRSVISDEKAKNAASDSADVRANQYDDDVIQARADDMEIIADALLKLKHQNAGNQGVWKRFGMKALNAGLRVLDFLTTGDLQLASENPVQWALEDENIDKDVAHTVLSLKEASIRAGMISELVRSRDILTHLTSQEREVVQPTLDEINELDTLMRSETADDIERRAAAEQKESKYAELERVLGQFTSLIKSTSINDLSQKDFARFEAAGRETFRAVLKDYAARFVLARNVLAISRSDLSEAALNVVASRSARKSRSTGIETSYSYGDGKVTTDFHSPEFVAAHADDIENAKREVIQRVVQLASTDAIKVNTNARFNVNQSTAAVIDYQRAISQVQGSEQQSMREVLAAIQALPIFANMKTVHDASGGQILREEDLSAFGRSGDVHEFLQLPTEGERLNDAQLRKVLKFMGREEYVFATDAQNRAAAARFLTQLHILAESGLPVRHTNASGENVAVTYEFSHDPESGQRLITPYVWSGVGENGQAEGTPAPVGTFTSVSQCVSALAGFGINAELRRLTFAKRFSITSRDATSLLLTHFGTRDAAREFYLRQGASEDSMPPYLRKHDVSGDWMYNEVEAMELMRKELALSNVHDDSDAAKEAFARTQRSDATGLDGYEKIAEKYLGSLGIHRTNETREESILVGAGGLYVMHPSSLTIKDNWVITSDFQASGESEALLRSTVASTLTNVWRRPDMAGLSRGELRDIVKAVVAAFDAAAERVRSALSHNDPVSAERIRMAIDSFKTGDESRFNFEKLAAIVSSSVCFTGERGFGEAGNGFLLAPELAAIADEFRADPAYLSLIDVVDRAFGGRGLIAEGKAELRGVRRLVDAFSPSGAAIAHSRTTKIFNRLSDPGVVVPSVQLAGVNLAPEGTGRVADITVLPRKFSVRDNNLEVSSVGGILDAIVENVSTFVAQYADQVSSAPLSAAEFFQMCVRASASGGETAEGGERASVSYSRNRNGVTNRVRKMAGVPVSRGTRPKTTEVISPVEAVKLGRRLSFLTQGAIENRVAAVRGALHAEDALTTVFRIDNTGDGSSITESATYTLVREFLQSRGMDDRSIEVVMDNLRNAITSDMSEEDPEAASENDSDELNDAIDAGANTESWMDAKKTNAAINDKDLIEAGRMLMHIFPKEKRNHMAVYFRMVKDIERIAKLLSEGEISSAQARYGTHDRIKAHLGTPAEQIENIKAVAKYLNVLRTRAGEPAIDAISSAEGWDDPELAEYRLSTAIVTLADLGHTELAFALNTLLNIGGQKHDENGKPTKESLVRRTKSLRNLGYLARLDTNAARISVDKDGEVTMDITGAGTGNPGSEDAIRASVNHAILHLGESMNGGRVGVDTLDSAWQRLNLASMCICPRTAKLAENYVRKYDEEHRGDNGGRGTRATGILRRVWATMGVSSDVLGRLATVDKVIKDALAEVEPGKVTPEAHAAVCEYAAILTERLSKVADTIDILFGRGNEVTYALRQEGLTRQIIDSIEFLFSRKLAEGQDIHEYREIARKGFARDFEALMDSTIPHETDGEYGKYHVCELIEHLLLRPLNVVTRYVSMTGAVDHFRERAIFAMYNSHLPVRIARCEVASLAYSANGGVPNSVAESKWVRNPSSGRARSMTAKLMHWYEASMPRSTVRAPGVSGGRFGENGQVTAMPASPIVAQARLEDTLLKRLPNIVFGQDLSESTGNKTLRDQYLSNGSKFADGTGLIVATAGASVAQTSTDIGSDGSAAVARSFLAREVFHANVASYVSKNDTRTFRFQLYHGEKPTVYSVQLPSYVAGQIFAAILARESWTRNVITDELLETGVLKEGMDIDEIEDMETRRAVYDALFSVVADHAGCAEIDSKRTQVLMSQGTPFSGHTDSITEMSDETRSYTARGVAREVNIRIPVKVNASSVHQIADANGTEGDPVVPATHFVISISGSAATENMGMYFAHGRLIETQRGISTNPDAVSFKNHLTDWSGVSLTKGQCHAIGLGVYEDEDIPTLGALREAQRAQRREVERILGLNHLGKNILDLPTRQVREAAETGDEAAKTLLENREKAVKLVENFFKFSTTISTDMETQKSGPFGSRCGLYAAGETDIVTLRIGGKLFQMRGPDKSAGEKNIKVRTDENGEWVDMPEDMPVPEFKNNAWPVALVVPLAMRALNINELSEEDTANIEGKWVNGKGKTTNGALADAKIFHSLRTAKGDKLSFAVNEAGGYVARYSTRSTIGQIMANADATSKSTNEHPSATNYVRDLVANQAFINRLDPKTSVAAIVTVARGAVQSVFRNEPSLVEDRIMSDPDYAFKSAQFPYSDTIREGKARKRNSILAKAMRVYPSATHAVLVGSGLQAKVDRFTHKATVARGCGVTDYDVDALRSARVLRTDAVAALKALYGDQYAVDRTYSSGLVNIDVTEKGDPAFRYGMHLDDQAFMNHALVKELLDNEGVRDTHTKYLETLRAAYPEESTGTDLNVVAALGAIMKAARRDKALLERVLTEVVGECFIDYTGKKMKDTARELKKLAINDLFIGEEFDFLAVEFGSHRKVAPADENGAARADTIYLGGSFFSGDRRPSGNFESASGLARAQAPVTRTVNGLPGKSAMYVLDPVQSAVQGSDTDGDSATLIKMTGHGHAKTASSFVREAFDFFTRIAQRQGSADDPVRKLKMSLDDAKEFIDTFSRHPDFKRYFTTVSTNVKGVTKDGVVDFSPRFREELGNLLFQAQIDNYRMIETREQSVERGADARSVKGSEIADQTDGDLLDVGFSGRDPVGPDAVFGDPMKGASAKELYRRICGFDAPGGIKLSSAFKDCINALSEKAGIPSKMQLLDAEQAAFLSGSAADANEARGVMVAIQAAIEHLKGYSRDDETIRKLCPALYDAYQDANGVIYDPIREFVAHLDGISNALFDVVKDLFAPRAGWQKNMLSYLIGSLLRSANDEYAAAGVDAFKTCRFDSEWFFERLVAFAEEFHSEPDSIPGLLKRANDANNFRDHETFGVKRRVTLDGNYSETEEEYEVRTRTLRGMVSAAAADENTVLSFFADLCRVGGDETITTKLSTLLTRNVLDRRDGEFERHYASWLRDLGLQLRRRNANGSELYGTATGAILAAFREGTAPEGLQKVIAALAEAPRNGEPMGDYAAVKELTDRLGELFSTGDTATVAAVASRVLFGDFSMFGTRLAEAESAVEAMSGIEAIQFTNAVVSPEKQFANGSAAASQLFARTGTAVKNVDEDNEMFRTQLFVIGDRVIEMINSQFDPEVLNDRISSDNSEIKKFAAYRSNSDTRSDYEEFCRVNGVRGFNAKDHYDVLNFIAAELHGGRTSVSLVGDNRRKMGPMLWAVERALGLYGSKEEFLQIVEMMYPLFAMSTKANAKAAAYEKSGEYVVGASEYDFDESASTDTTDGHMSMLASLIENILLTGAQSNAEFFLSHLNVTSGTGQVKLESRLGPGMIEVLRKGFHELLTDNSIRDITYRVRKEQDDGSFRYEVDDRLTDRVRMRDIGVMLMLHLCAHQAFDAVNENDTRVDISCIFSEAELREMGRYGQAAESSFVGRALMRVPQATAANGAANGGYNYLRKIKEDDRSGIRGISVTTLLSNIHPGRPNTTPYGEWTNEDCRKYITERAAELSPLQIMVNTVTTDSSWRQEVNGLIAEETDTLNGLRARGITGVENNEFEVSKTFSDAPIDGTSDSPVFDMLVPKTFGLEFVGPESENGGDVYDSLEDAINAYSAGYAEYVGGLKLKDGSTVRDRGVETFISTYARGRRVVNLKDGTPNPYRFSAVARRVLEDTRERVGDEAFKKWLKQATLRGGESQLDPAVHEQLRTVIKEMDAALNPKPQKEERARVVLGHNMTLADRMLRSGFTKFLQESDPAKYQQLVTNPYENIKFAMEAAFGKYDAKNKTGAKVGRVRQKDPKTGVFTAVNLIRITRFIKTRENGVLKSVPVTTYISFGDMLHLDVTDKLYLESIAQALTKAGTPITVEGLLKMSEAERDCLVRELGLRVAGTSKTDITVGTGLTTNALLALTGLIRLGHGSDYYTLFHEYFHQMIEFCRNTGLLTTKDEAELAKAFSSGGKFDEEAAADAFAAFVADAAEGLGGKPLAAGIGADPDNDAALQEIFKKLHEHAQALLAGVTAFDVSGMPVFMQMLVSGDFSTRESKHVTDVTSAQMKRVENMLLGEEVDFDLRSDYLAPNGSVTEAGGRIIVALDNLKKGKGSLSDVRKALQGKESAEAEEHVVFPAKTAPFGADVPAPEPAPAPTVSVTPRGAIVRDRSVPGGVRLQELLSEALEKFENGTGLTEDEKKAILFLRRRVDGNTSGLSYDECDLIIGIADRLLTEACNMLGISRERWNEEWLREGLDPEVARLAPKTRANSAGIKINFTESDHKYWSTLPDGKELVYTSGTSFIAMFGSGFDKDKAAEKTARRRNTTAEKVKEEWEAASEFGTMIHSVYEDVFSGSDDIRAFRTAKTAVERKAVMEAQYHAKQLLRDYPKATVVGAECLVFDPETRVAGSIDLVVKLNDKEYLLVDHKTNAEVPTDEYAKSKGNKMTGPLSHLYDGHLERYRLQLNLYRELAVRSGLIPAGAKVKMEINHFRGSGEATIIPIESRAREVSEMLKYAREHPDELIPSGTTGSRVKPIRPGDANVVAELAVRIAHRVAGTFVNTDENGAPTKPEYYAPKVYAQLANVLNGAFASADSNSWPTSVIEMKTRAAEALSRAIEDLRARADVARQPGNADTPEMLRKREEDYTSLIDQAENLEKCLDRLQDIVWRLARGEDLSKYIRKEDLVSGADLYDSLFRYVTNGAKLTVLADGSVRYEATSDTTMPLDGRDCQNAADLIAQSLGAAVILNKYVKEIGATAALGVLPVIEHPKLVPVPRATEILLNADLEPDTTPQMILQSQTSWMASDIQRQFFGVNLRDMMTDSSYQALVEETNRVANNISFYYGADVVPGGRPRAIKYETSYLGRTDIGTFEVDKSRAHRVRKVAAVRGRLLGIITRSAETAGDVDWTVDDVNTVNIAGQIGGCLASGDNMLLTGIDIPVMDIRRTRLRFAAPVSESTGGLRPVSGLLSVAQLIQAPSGNVEGGHYCLTNVISRVKAIHRGLGENSADGIDRVLERIAVDLPSMVTGCVRDEHGELTGEVIDGGLYSAVIKAYRDALSEAGKESAAEEFRQLVIGKLVDNHAAMQSATGRAVIGIDALEFNTGWLSSKTVEKLVNAGRQKELLDIRYYAQIISGDAARLHRAASKAKYMTDQFGAPLSGNSAAGLWFDEGTGHHGIHIDRHISKLQHFNGELNLNDKLKDTLKSFTYTVESENHPHRVNRAVRKVGDRVRGYTVKGLDLAFERDGSRLINLSINKVQHLIQLIGLGREADSATIEKFVTAVENGLYSSANPDNTTGLNISTNTTLFELDRQIYQLECALLLEEDMNPDKIGNTVLTRSTSEGGFGFTRGELVSLNEVLRRSGIRMLADQQKNREVSGVINTVSETMMFQRYGKLGSEKTGAERIRSMANSIVTAERFRGCLAQMLTTVGSSGLPNFIVSPTESAKNLVSDEYWGAVAKFIGQAVQPVLKGKDNPWSYDDFKSGIDNMRDLARVFDLFIKEDLAAAKNVKSKARRSLPWHFIPPYELGAGEVFDNIMVLDDGETDNVSVMNKLVGGEAEGYLRQLFGTVTTASVWSSKWKTLDRLMSYSKAMSVGMSAFFAFATRFESATAAGGIIAGLSGQAQWTAKTARALEKVFGAKEMAKIPLMADFMRTITSDDPVVRDMRELCHLVGIPLSDAIHNPFNDAGGQIDKDIDRVVRWLEVGGHYKTAKEVRGVLKAALQNSGEYAFSQVLNCVQMAVVAQTMYRLRKECEIGRRPFDPVRELRKIAPYLSTEIGGIRAERYAWLTPGMQKVLRMTMFSWQWTMSAWTAGSGEVITDLLFGGHNTNKEMRRNAFIRWMRMLGFVKVGVPVFMQALIRWLATLITKAGLVGNPDDDDPAERDPLGIERMPWLCFNNESKIGALCFDVTPILKLCGRIREGADEFSKDAIPGYKDYIAPGLPWITSAIGAAWGGVSTRSVGGMAIGAGLGMLAPKLFPSYEGVGRGRNTSGRRRYYMHFGKQSDEFWGWFTNPWSQATNKLSIPTQKAVEAFFGSTNGSSFSKAFADRELLDRFVSNIATLDPQENAVVNFFTAFLPFSAASLANHPDSGALAMFAPVRMGESMTGAQKRIAARLKAFALDDSKVDVWASPKNRKQLNLLCADILAEADLNGLDVREVLKSGLGTVSGDLYRDLFEALPRAEGDSVDGARLTRTLRALRRINIKNRQITGSLKKKYKAANLDWADQRNAVLRAAVRGFLEDSTENPWYDPDVTEENFRRRFDEGAEALRLRATEVRQDAKGGEMLSNFLATDNVPGTLFGVPIVTEGYTDEDLEFFKANPEAGGYYDMGKTENGGGEPPEGPAPGGPEGEEPPPENLDPTTPQGTRGVGGGGDTISQLNKDLSTRDYGNGLTEQDVIDLNYRKAKPWLDGEFQRNRAMEERISRYDSASQQRIRDSVASGGHGGS